MRDTGRRLLAGQEQHREAEVVAHTASDRWVAPDCGPGRSLTRVRARVATARGSVAAHGGHAASVP
jgi:hypothetical protein